MTELYAEPAAAVSFGDIFEASFLFDVYVRADAVQLGRRAAPQKHGGGFAFSASFREDRAYVLGHGAPHRAILITDDCVVDTALGQGREDGKPKGRLLFAPISPATESDLKTQAFGRFALPASGKMRDGVVELRKCFMVDARDVADHINARVATLAPCLVEDLEVRWNAFAARRGPFAALRNAEKLVGVLIEERGAGEPDEGDKVVGQEVAAVVATAWRLEGSDLEAVADAFNDKTDGSPALAALEAGLRELSDQAAKAAEMVSNARARTSASD